MKIYIESIAYEAPPRIISSEEIESRLSPLYERLNLPLGRLKLMTGIRERKFWEDQKEKPSQGAIRASKKLAESLNDIDALFYTGVCRDRLEPATASYVHAGLGLSNKALAIDLSNACVGFLNGIFFAKEMIASRAIKRALIVASENGESLLENTIHTLLTAPLNRQSIKPYFANLTIGAGAVAMVISTEEALLKKPIGELKTFHYQNDTSSVHLCEGEEASVNGEISYSMSTDSEALLKAGLALAKNTWSGFKQKCGEVIFDKILTHQVGKQHALGLYEAIEASQEKGFFTYPEWGNVGSVSLPLTLASYLENNNPLSERIALLGIGSGLTCMMAELNVLHSR